MAVANWHALLGHGEAWVRMTRDNILEVYAGVVDIGTGAKTQMAMIAAGVLGMPVERIRMIYGDTSISPFAIAEVGSMTTGFVGPAVREACDEAQGKTAVTGFSKTRRKKPYDRGYDNHERSERHQDLRSDF